MHAATTEDFVAAKWDRAGVVGSLVCIFHCVATPFLAATLPILAVTEKETHLGLTLMLMLIGLLAFLPGYRQHNKPFMGLVAGLGFAMLVLAVFIPERLASETLETGLTLAGGILLISAHLTNAYYCRQCRVCAKDLRSVSARMDSPASYRRDPLDGSATASWPIRVIPDQASHCGMRITGGDGNEVSEDTCSPGSDRLSPDLRRPEPESCGAERVCCLRR